MAEQKGLRADCIRHGEFIGLETCPVCDREQYINRLVAERTQYLVEENNKLHRLLREKLGLKED